jgi:hypothetical protein
VTIVDGTEISNKNILVEKPVPGLSMSAPTFYFNIAPYGTGFISSWNTNVPANSTSLSTKNTGNVPLTFRITYESMNNLFTTSNSTGTSNPAEERTHFINFQAQSWSPRQFTIKGTVNGEPQLLMTPNTVTTIVAVQTTFDVVVTVARPGYQIYQMDGVTVQYKSFYRSAYYRQSLSLNMYITGNKSVYLSPDMNNLTFNNFENQGTKTQEDLLLVLNDLTEQHIIANITCSSAPPWKQPTMMAYANFNLSLSDNTGTGRFTSNVVVSATAEENNEFPVPLNVFIVLVLAIVFIVIAIFMFGAYRKTEEEKRKELEDKIRRKKERARKQRRN